LPKLTINLGLRYEYIGLPVDLYGRNGAFDPRFYQTPSAGGSTSLGFTQEGNARHPVPGIAKVSNTLTDNVNHLNFAPRVGLSAQVLPRVVLRAGYGIFYDRLSNQLGLLESLSVPNYVRTDGKNSSGGPTAQINASGSLANPFPTLPLASQFPQLPLIYSSSAVNAPAPISINDVDPKIRTPYYQQYGANVQTQFSRSTMLEIGYVGARGLRLPGSSFCSTARWPVSTMVAAQACVLPRCTTRSYVDQPAHAGTRALGLVSAAAAANRLAASPNSVMKSIPVLKRTRPWCHSFGCRGDE